MSFTSFAFHPQISANITACGFTVPTPIQQQSIPPVLAGRDILGLAQTGTGKTAAFVLPLLQRLLAGPRKKVRALIVAPTRELAEQIHGDITRLAAKTGLKSATIYGGVGKHPQVIKVRAGVEIIVACPGRLLDHLRDGNIKLNQVETLVLDEADHLFDMGFLPDIRRIMQHLPKERQTLLFSATMPSEVRHLAEDVLTDPALVQINHEKPTETVTHLLFPVEQSRKTALLKNLLAREEFATALVFTRTKHKAKNVARQLEAAGFPATSIQGNLSQAKRQQAMDGFRQGTFKILVATDIAARGIDVKGISHVINYDVPDTVAAYTHRIGRTGRASLTGDAVTFASREDGAMIRDIERTLGKSMARQTLPEQLATEAPDDRPERPRRSFTPGNRTKTETRRPGRGAAPLGLGHRTTSSGRPASTSRRTFSS